MIPKSIHQYWDKADPPREALESYASLSGVNPDYAIRLWSHADARAYILNTYGSAVAEIFSRCKLPAMQADFFRYCILLAQGGIYADSDATALVAFDDCLNESLVLPITNRKDLQNPGLGNCFIAATPWHPVLAFALGQCLYNIVRETTNNVARVTGPGVLHRALMFQRDLAVQLLDPLDGYVDNFNLAQSATEQHWSERQARESIFLAATDTAVTADDWVDKLLDTSLEETQLSPSAVPSATLESIRQGCLYACFEHQLGGRGDWQSPATCLLGKHDNHDFSPLRVLTDAPETADIVQWEALVNQWRRDLVLGRTSRFQQSMNELLQGLLDGRKSLPEEGAPSPGLWLAVAQQLDADGHSSLAIEAMRQALSNSAYDRKIWIAASKLFCQQRLFDDTVIVAKAVLARDPANAAALHFLFRAYDQGGDSGDALGVASDFVERVGNELSYVHQVNTAIKVDDLALARGSLAAGMAKFPDSARLRALLPQVEA